MKKQIYVGHSNDFDYERQLYKPLRESTLDQKFTLVFPYEKRKKPFNSQEVIKTSDAMVAEVSYPSTGLGIEIGWAYVFKVPIISIAMEDAKVSRSPEMVSDNFIRYSDTKDMIEKLNRVLINCNTPHGAKAPCLKI